MQNTKLARAYLCQQTGREQKANVVIQRFRASFNKAAKLFYKLGMLEQCADCFEAAGFFSEAAGEWKPGATFP